METKPYVILIPKDDRPALVLDRSYSLIAQVTKADALEWKRRGFKEKWEGYIGGPRPEGYGFEEPLDAYWVW